MADTCKDVPLCDYQGYEFGANYPDSVCIDGNLWDADSGNGDGYLTSGGDIPCPKCQPEANAIWYQCDICKGDERRCKCQEPEE